MQQIPLTQTPNQSFTSLLDGKQWDFILKTDGDVTVVSLNLSGTQLVSSARAAAGALIIPSKYEENGNFFFVTKDQQLPFYTQFTVTQFLIYITAAELAALRAPKAPPITVSDFNPIAALPLRFSPQGYTEA